MGLDRNALYVPTTGEILTVMGTKDDQTVAWAVQMTAQAESPLLDMMYVGLVLRGKIIGARFETGLDSRVRTQKESIDRLMEHLKVHCPALREAAPCHWMEAQS